MSAPPIPNVLHGRAETRRFPDGEWRMVHPCGVLWEWGVTLAPHPSGVSPHTGEWVSAPRLNCPGCDSFFERHAALCAAVRR